MQTDRYAEYPKLKELVERKDGLIAARATAPTFLKVPDLNPSLLPSFMGPHSTVKDLAAAGTADICYVT